VHTAASILVFEVAGHLCGIRAPEVQEIVLLPALAGVPGQPAVIAGFLNLRGAAVPVVRLDRLFDIGARALPLHTPLIVIAAGGSLMALAADRVEDVASMPESELRPVAGAQSFNDCALAAFDFAGRVAALLEPGRILLEKERQCVADLRARVQAQLDSLGTPAA
jgi:purine-binding chemotaxis protein CheW